MCYRSRFNSRWLRMFYHYGVNSWQLNVSYYEQMSRKLHLLRHLVLSRLVDLMCLRHNPTLGVAFGHYLRWILGRSFLTYYATF